MALNIDAKFEGKLTRMTWKIWEMFVHRPKNSDLILESKMAELNKNKNSKKPDQQVAVWKLHPTWEINEYHN